MKELPLEQADSGLYDRQTDQDCRVLRWVDITENTPLRKPSSLMFTEDSTGLLVKIISAYRASDMMLGSSVHYSVATLKKDIDRIEPVQMSRAPDDGPMGFYGNFRYFAREMGLSPRGLLALIKKAAPVAVEA